MITWNIYRKSNGDLDAVKEGFNWWAFFAHAPWALYKGLIWQGSIGISINIAVSRLPVEENNLALIIGFGTLLVFGSMGNQWVCAKLEKQGYSHVIQVSAATKTGALAKYHEIANTISNELDAPIATSKTDNLVQAKSTSNLASSSKPSIDPLKFCSDSVKEENIACNKSKKDATPILTKDKTNGQELLSAVTTGDLVLFFSIINNPGIDVNALDPKGRTSLDIARARNDGEMFSVLIKHGGKPSSEIKKQ